MNILLLCVASVGLQFGTRLLGPWYYSGSFYRRRFLPPSIPRPLLLFCRPIMTKLVSVDILSNNLDTETDIQHPAGQPFMLAFVNIVGNHGAFTSDDGTCLKSALTFLSNNLHDRGTVVIALPDWEFNRTKLKGDI